MTVPVGVGFPLAAVTVTVTVSGCAVVMFEDDGVTCTVGVSFCAVSEVAADVLALKLLFSG